MPRTPLVVLLVGLMASPAVAFADPPIDSWDRDSSGTPPSPSAPPPPPSAAPSPSRAPLLRRPRRRRIVGRRRRIDLSSLKARDYGEKVTLGLFTGGRFYTNNAQLGNSNDLGVSVRSGVAFGLRTGYNITRFVGIQAEVIYQPSRYFDDGDLAHILGVRGFLLLHLPAGRWRPFLQVGGGVEMLPHDIDRVAQDYDGAFIGGLGAKYDMSHTVSLRFDVRGISTDGKKDGTVNWEALAGLTFRFMVQ